MFDEERIKTPKEIAEEQAIRELRERRGLTETRRKPRGRIISLIRYLPIFFLLSIILYVLLYRPVFVTSFLSSFF